MGINDAELASQVIVFDYFLFDFTLYRIFTVDWATVHCDLKDEVNPNLRL